MAKFSPSGKYIASGDNSGKVRVWSWTHPDKLLKNEAMVFAGEVEDLAWDGESKRILAVGGGQAKARFFLAETGTCAWELLDTSVAAMHTAIAALAPPPASHSHR